MDAHKISVKLFAADDVFDPAEFVPVFHRWIQTHALEDHLLIDVADYAHVPAGPGSLLVASEANIHMDRGESRLGLLYVRKRPLPGSFRDRLRGVLAEALKAAAKLEQEPGLSGRLKFRTDEIQVRLHDRLLATNTAETYAAVKEDFEAVAGELYAGGRFTLEHRQSPLELFEVRVRADESAAVTTLLERLGASATAGAA